MKILDDKIKANQGQYNLDRETSKISALSSGKLKKFLTGKNVGYKPGVAEQAKFEYSPLGKVFNKGLEEEDKKEGLLKRLKYVADKNEKHLGAIENKENIRLGIKSVISLISDKELSHKAESVPKTVSDQEKNQLQKVFL